MPRTKEKNGLIRDQRKEQLFAFAARVFARKGFTGTKIADIATEAGISQGLIYRYFTDKNDIFISLITQAINGMIRMAHQSQQCPGTSWTRFTWYTEQLLNELQQQPEFALVILQALTSEAAPPEAQKIAKQGINVMLAIIRHFIVANQAEQKIIAGDPDRLTNLYFSCIQGLALGLTFSNTLSFPEVDDVLSLFQRAEKKNEYRS